MFFCSLLGTSVMVAREPFQQGLQDRPLPYMVTAWRGPLRLDVDRGASGTWQMLQKLRTTASVMQVAAHPDEEAGGVMTLLSRLHGVRVASLTLTRGEGGDNAIGSEAFDALGLLRTEELLVSNRYYGVDEQYFTTAVDFGFTKRSNEAFDRWGRQQLLGEVVRVIRTSRPLVLLSRFQGTARDGHGSTAASVQVMREAFTAAADSAMFPEQLREGLRPWQPLKVYVGAPPEAAQTIVVDTGVYSPWLGQSYSEMARTGLGFQRSSVSPVNDRRQYTAAGPELSRFARMESVVATAATEQSFFDGIDTSLRGVFRMLRKPEPSAAAALLAAIEGAVEKAQTAFTIEDPSATVPGLAEGLTATRLALSVLSGADADVRALLQIKEYQFQEAISTALALDVTAIAQLAGAPAPTGPVTPPPVMAAPVPGQRFEVHARVTNRSGLSIVPTEIALIADRGWTIAPTAAEFAGLGRNDSAARRFGVTLADDVAVSSRPFFQRGSIREDRYTLSDPAQFSRAVSAPPAIAVVRYTVAGVTVESRQVVQRREWSLPDGHLMRELNVVPKLSVRVTPEQAVLPIQAATRRVSLAIDLLNNHDGEITGVLTLTLPEAWRAEPAMQAFRFEHAGERRRFPVTVTVPSIETRGYSITAVATVNGVRYSDGYDLIDQRDLELRYLYRPATAQLRGVDVAVVSNLSVGYVMGVGDQVPAGIAQLGYAVTQLKEADLAEADLARFDVIVTGTRAYAVREDLKTHHQRILEYVRQGGNLVVLYNTPELSPSRFAPFPGELGPRAEEVSEEDAVVRILAPAAQAMTWPNRITQADFDGWVEQRGSKFWDAWDPAYTAMLETADQGQALQRGGWLQASYGGGTYTYLAYALHRQLPNGVPGAYRLLANVLGLARTPPGRP